MNASLYKIILFSIWLVIVILLSIRIYSYCDGYQLNFISNNYSSLVKITTNGQAEIKDNLRLEGIIHKFPEVTGNRQVIELNRYKIITTRSTIYKTGDYVKLESGKIKINKKKYNISNGKIVGIGSLVNGKNKDLLLYTGEPCGKRSRFLFVYYPHITIYPERSNYALNIIYDIRNSIINKVQTNFKEPFASYVLGMTIGYTDGLNDEFTDKLKFSGLIHILVVSGYNVSLLLQILFILFAKWSIRFYIVVLIVFLLLFVGIVGVNPPVLRAVVVGAIGAFSRITGRPSQSAYLLFIAGILMVLIWPNFLFDISFQLSFVATIAIILSVNMINLIKLFKLQYRLRSNDMLAKSSTSYSSKLYKNILKYIKSEVFVLFNIQLLIFPVISYYFGIINLNGIISNLLVGWVVPYITILSVVFIFSFGIIKLVTQYFLYMLILYVNTVVEAVSKNDTFVFEFKVKQIQVVTIYLVIALIYVVIFKFINISNEI